MWFPFRDAEEGARVKIHILIATHKTICARGHFEPIASTSYILYLMQL